MAQQTAFRNFAIALGNSRWLAVWVLVSYACCTTAHGQGASAEAPQVKVGDYWKQEQKDRRTGNKDAETVRTVTSVGPLGFEGTENDGKFSATSEWNPKESSTQTLAGDATFLRFPLTIGSKWEAKYSFANKANPGKGRIQFEAEVVAYEKVTVAAGTFDAFRIEAKGFWNNDASRTRGNTKYVYWYAPAARATVKMQYSDGGNDWIRELVEYRLQP